jgi:hypothetical protein
LLPNGKFFKVPDIIRSTPDLREWILKKKPLDVYYSTACFLAPDKVGSRTEKISENLFLYADLVFDIDFEPFCVRNIERARLQALKLLDFLKRKKIEIKYLAFSGSKGFHVVCKDPWKYAEASPLDRESKAKQFRKSLAEEISGLGIKIDSKVTVDTRRILRLPGTINSKTGLECILLSETDLALRAIQIIKKPRRINITASLIPLGNDRLVSPESKILGLNRLEARSNPPYYYSSFLSSRVIGTKLHVPIIALHTRSEKKALQKISQIQCEYGLSDFFLFRGDSLFAIGLDALQKARIAKILKKANSQNLAFFKKYGNSFVRISPKVSEKMRIVCEAPAFLFSILSENSAARPVSKSHLLFLKQCSIDVKDYPFLVGKEEFSLSHCLIEN